MYRHRATARLGREGRAVSSYEVPASRGHALFRKALGPSREGDHDPAPVLPEPSGLRHKQFFAPFLFLSFSLCFLFVSPSFSLSCSLFLSPPSSF